MTEPDISLAELPLEDDGKPLPADVRHFLHEAEQRIERFQRDCRVPGFVPCDFPLAYRALRALAAADLAPGNLFCEWGSGFGVVACLAAMLDFDAFGIEIDGELVDEARRLATDFELPVEFVRGSFIPAGSAPDFESEAAFEWLDLGGADAAEELGLGPDDFDVIFAYPWPDEQHVITDLFARHARPGALLMSYHTEHDVRLRRKLSRRARGRTIEPQRHRGTEKTRKSRKEE